MISLFGVGNYYILEEYSTQVIKNNLIYILPVFLSFNFILLLVSGILSWNSIKNPFKNISKKTWFILIFILLLSLLLRTGVAPIGHRIYYDEDIYLNIGQNILQENKAILCNYGVEDKCFEWIMNKQPHAFPFLISLLFRIFGVSESVGFGISIFSGVMSSFLIFLIAYLLTKKEEIGLFSSLLFALIPVHIRWSATSAVEPTTVFFILFVFFSLLIYLKNKKIPNLIFSIASLAFAVQFRPEILLIVPLSLLLIIFKDKNPLKTFNSKKFLLGVLLFLVLIVPHTLQLGVFSESSWGSEGKKFSFGHAQENIKPNSTFYFDNQRFPVLFTIFFLIGTLYSLKKIPKNGIFLLLWFLFFFLIYVFFYAGSYNYGVDVRFSLLTYAPLVILAGYGIFALRKIILGNRKIIFTGLVMLIFIQFSLFIPFISKFGEEGWDAREVHDFAIKEIKTFDEDCYVLSHVPSMFLVNGVNSLQSWNAKTNKKRMKDIFSKTDCVLFYKGYWCQVEPYKSEICDYILENYETEVYSEKTARSKEFVFYRILE